MYDLSIMNRQKYENRSTFAEFSYCKIVAVWQCSTAVANPEIKRKHTKGT